MNECEDLNQTISSIRRDPMNIEGYLQRGISWYNCKCYDECASDLLYYESKNGENPIANKYLGMALSKTNGKHSLKYLQLYVQSVPNDSETIAYLAESFFQIGDYQNSATYYQIAVNNGYDSEIMTMKATTLAESGMYNEAQLFDSSFGKRKKLFRR